MSPAEVAPPIRQDLIDTARTFLQNPQVQQAPLTKRIAFLEQKGLTQAEIQLALQPTGTDVSTSATPSPSVAVTTQNAPAAVPPPSAGWIPARTYAVPMHPTHLMVYVAAGSLLGATALHWIHRLAVPACYHWLGWDPRTDEEKRADQLSETLDQLMESVAQQQRGQVDLQRQLADMKQSFSSHDQPVTAMASEVQQELKSLKGLLLNRRQFACIPADPIPAGVDTASKVAVPSWQLQMPTSSKLSLLSAVDAGSDREQNDLSEVLAADMDASEQDSPLAAGTLASSDAVDLVSKGPVLPVKEE